MRTGCQTLAPWRLPLPDDAPHPSDLPYLTAELPGTGGTLKAEPEDFAVEELPAYEPSGEGEHLFLWIEKRNVSADELLRHLARTLDVPRSTIGTAGIKDKRAVTRQYVSVPRGCEGRLPQAATDSISVLKAAPHGNKLRAGHLRGNRFSILVRDVDEAAAERGGAIAAQLAELGVPNYYGEQRFGIDNQTLQTGLDLLSGAKQPRHLPRAKRKFLMRLSLSAVQAHLFNQALAERLARKTLHVVQAGDVMQVVESGGVFVAEEVAQEQPRLDAREIAVTGPMFGPKMKAPTGPVAETEQTVLQAFGLSPADFEKFPKLTRGTRRPYLIWPGDLTLQPEAGGLRLEFTLPPGSYATVLMREVMKGNDLA